MEAAFEREEKQVKGGEAGKADQDGKDKRSLMGKKILKKPEIDGQVQAKTQTTFRRRRGLERTNRQKEDSQ